jgi:hypothetical protein
MDPAPLQAFFSRIGEEHRHGDDVLQVAAGPLQRLIDQREDRARLRSASARAFR